MLRWEPCIPPITTQSARNTLKAHLLYSRENSSRKPLKVVATVVQGYLYPTPIGRSAHSGSHAQTGRVSDGGCYHYSRRALRGPESLRAQRSRGHTLWVEGILERSRKPSERRRASCAPLFRGAAAPQDRAAPLLVLALYRRASRLVIAASKCGERFVDGLVSFCLQDKDFFFGYSGAFLGPLFASTHARKLSFGTTIRLPILSAGNSLPCTSS